MFEFMNQYSETYTYYECCATPKCEAPDKARDPTRTIVAHTTEFLGSSSLPGSGQG